MLSYFALYVEGFAFIQRFSVKEQAEKAIIDGRVSSGQTKYS